MRRRLHLLLACGLYGFGVAVSAAPPQAIAVIAHAGVGAVDATLLKRLYTGRAIAVDGQPVVVSNAGPGSEIRESFIERVLRDTEAQYTAYWIVRRHVGKGLPPVELAGSREAVDFVRRTPGGIAYVPASEVPPGTNVIYRHPPP